MARKRLTPADPARLAGPELETKAMGLARTVVRQPPIARVAGESAAESALTELSAEVASARAEGRMVLSLPLDAVEAQHLVRDRIAADDAEMATLKASIAARGQQTPIEVVELGDGRFGLISGWRRLTALRALRDETGDDRFATVQALLRRPENAAAAYQAMIDENEVRVGLSYWERARAAAKAAELGLYPTPRHAVRALFATASRPKRSKINSFLVLYEALDGALRFPAALPERLGLDLARAIEADAALGPRLRAALDEAAPADAAAEQSVLARCLAPRRTAAPPQPGVRLMRKGRRLVLEGDGVDAALEADLEAWLAARA